MTNKELIAKARREAKVFTGTRRRRRIGKLRPHPSHRMTPWRHTIICLLETPRFGSIRKCRRCGAEHGVTVAGELMFPELYVACTEESRD